MIKRLQQFPDTESVARLESLKVRYVLVHQALYKPDEYSALMGQIARRPELIPSGRYRDWTGVDTQIFELQRSR